MDETEVGLRLQELLDLYSRGAISEQEYVQARARVLGGAPTDVHWVDFRPPTLPVVYGPPPGGGPASSHRTRSVVIVVSAAVLLVALVAGGPVWVRWPGRPRAPPGAAGPA